VEGDVVDTGNVLTAAGESGQDLRIPLHSYEGNWVDPARTGRVVVRYADDPYGSQDRAAEVANQAGEVVGIMPHPERASDPLLGSDDGLVLLEGFVRSLRASVPA